MALGPRLVSNEINRTLERESEPLAQSPNGVRSRRRRRGNETFTAPLRRCASSAQRAAGRHQSSTMARK